MASWPAGTDPKHDGKIWQPEERIDRGTPTRWTRGRQLRKPDQSIARGREGRHGHLGRDYFTVPEDDILKVRRDQIGGKMSNLNASLATEWGVPQVGPQFNFQDSQMEWIGKAFTEVGKREAAAAPR
jgi:hypothetical protein